jgi:hypothetical protein
VRYHELLGSKGVVREYNQWKKTFVVKYYKNETSKRASKMENYTQEELTEELYNEELHHEEPEEREDDPPLLLLMLKKLRR